MNLRIVFKAQSIVLLLNAIGGLFLTATFMAQANFAVTADLITLGQFMGMTFLIISIWSWRIPDIAGYAFNAMGRLFAIGGGLWTLIILYHIVVGAVSGPTAYVNVILTALFAIGFYIYSRDWLIFFNKRSFFRAFINFTKSFIIFLKKTLYTIHENLF